MKICKQITFRINTFRLTVSESPTISTESNSHTHNNQQGVVVRVPECGSWRSWVWFLTVMWDLGALTHFYNDIKITYTVQNLVWRDRSKCIHVHTYIQVPAHAGILTIHNLIYNQLKQITNRDLRWKKPSVCSGKHGRSIQTWDCYRPNRKALINTGIHFDSRGGFQPCLVLCRSLRLK